MVHKVYDIHYLALYGKSLLSLILEHQPFFLSLFPKLAIPDIQSSVLPLLPCVTSL